jgi:3-oxoacyl-[acyl-carrier protein] reductase
MPTSTESRPPLAGRVALITGVSRPVGIAYALTRRLLADGASVLATGWGPHDAEVYGTSSAPLAWPLSEGPRSGAFSDGPFSDEPLSAGPLPDGLLSEGVSSGGARVRYLAADLARPEVPAELIQATIDAWGAIDIVVACHARGVIGDLAAVTAAELDLTYAVNTRATILLAQALAARHDDDRPGGRFILFTSGQHLGPMPGEIAYIASKGANHQITASLADALSDQAITVNCVNPGPVDTGYAFGEAKAKVAAKFPAGRWGTPEDTARLVAWLVSDEAAWITGQVFNSEGGFRRG